MPVSRSAKEEAVKELGEALANAESIILLDFTGLDVPRVTELRRQMRAASGVYRVVKNTLAQRAVVGTAFESLRRNHVRASKLRVRSGVVPPRPPPPHPLR